MSKIEEKLFYVPSNCKGTVVKFNPSSIKVSSFFDEEKRTFFYKNSFMRWVKNDYNFTINLPPLIYAGNHLLNGRSKTFSKVASFRIYKYSMLNHLIKGRDFMFMNTNGNPCMGRNIGKFKGDLRAFVNLFWSSPFNNDGVAPTFSSVPDTPEAKRMLQIKIEGDIAHYNRDENPGNVNLTRNLTEVILGKKFISIEKKHSGVWVSNHPELLEAHPKLVRTFKHGKFIVGFFKELSKDKIRVKIAKDVTLTRDRI